SAQPYQAFVSTDLNLRSGPGTEYPPVLVLPAGVPVVVHGCLEGWSWCDVSWGEARGWVAGSYLSYEQYGARVPVVQVAPTIGLPIIAFSLGSYWDNHYRGRPWYRDRDRWVSHYHARPPHRYRPPVVHHRPSHDFRRDWDRGRNDWGRGPDRDRRDWNRRDRDRRPDVVNRPDRRPDFRPDRDRDRRVEHRRDDRPRGDRRGASPPYHGYSGGADERAAQRFNRERSRSGPMPGE
ncbi:MAG: SH3 domain-containing protein, partial [Alphaproteobacteria bacterium]